MGYITRPPYSNDNRLKIIRSNKFSQDIKFVCWDMPELKRNASTDILIEHDPNTYEITNSLLDDSRIHYIAKIQTNNISEPHTSYTNIQQTSNRYQKLNAINVGNALANYYEYWGYTNDMGMYFDENGKGYAGGFHILNFGTRGSEYYLFGRGTATDSIATFYNQDLYTLDANNTLFVGYANNRTSRQYNTIGEILALSDTTILRFADWMELCIYQFKTACDTRNLCYPAFFTLDVEDSFGVASLINTFTHNSVQKIWLDIIRNNAGNENPNRWATAKLYEEWNDSTGAWENATWASAFLKAYGSANPTNPYDTTKAYFQGLNRDAYRKLSFISEKVNDYILDKIYYQPARRYFPRIICGNYGITAPISGEFGVNQNNQLVNNVFPATNRDPVLSYPFGEKGNAQTFLTKKQIKAELQNPVCYTPFAADGILGGTDLSFASTGFENNTQITAFTRGVNSATIIYVFGILSNGLGSIARYDGTTWTKIADVRQADGTPGVISSAVIFNGRIFFAGNFTTIHKNDGTSVSCSNIASFNDATSVSTINFTTHANTCNGQIRAMVVHLSNNLYIGGDFTTINGATFNRIARLNFTDPNYTYNPIIVGTTNGIDSNPTGQAISSVFCFLLRSSDLYVGGSFRTIAGATYNRVVRYNITSGSWHAIGSGVNNTVRSLALYKSRIYVGGDFTDSNLSPRIAYFDPTNNTWTSVGISSSTNTGLNLSVHALHTSTIGGIEELYIGGDFTQTNSGFSLNRFAKIASTNDFLTAIVPSTNVNDYKSGVNSTVNVITTYINTNTIVLGGSFSDITSVNNYQVANLLATWNGSTYGKFGNFFDATPYCCCTYTFNGSNYLVVGGKFVSDFNRKYVTPANNANNIAMCLLPASNSTAITTSANWIKLNGGTLVENATIDGSVYAVAQFGNDLYVGGNFTSVSNSVTDTNARIDNSYIVKWNGTAWSYLNIDSNNPKAKLNGIVYCIFVHTVGVTSTLYVGGAFTSTSGDGNAILLNRIAKFNTTTNEWDQVIVAGGVGFNNTVYTIAVDQNNNLIIGGEFTANGNETATFNRIAKYNNTSFSQLSYGFANGAVKAISFYTENMPDQNNQSTYLIVSGSFTEAYVTYTSISVNTKKPIGRVAALKNNIWDGISYGYLESHGANKTINAITKIPTFSGFAAAGEIILGGEFTKWNERTVGSSREEVYNINANGICHFNFNKSHFSSLKGSLTSYLPDDNGINGTVNGFAIAPGSRYIHIIGSFTQCHDVSYNKVVRLYFDPRKSRIGPKYSTYFYADPIIASDPLTGGVNGGPVDRNLSLLQPYYEYQYYGRDRKTIWEQHVRQKVRACLANNNVHEVVPWISCPFTVISDFYAEQYFPDEIDFINLLKDYYKLGLRNFYIFNPLHANQGLSYQNIDATSPHTLEKKKLDVWMREMLEKFDAWLVNFDNDNSVTKRVFRGRGRSDGGVSQD